MIALPGRCARRRRVWRPGHAAAQHERPGLTGGGAGREHGGDQAAGRRNPRCPSSRSPTIRIATASPTSCTPGPIRSWTAPCRAIRIAIKPPKGAAERDRGLDVAHLIALLDRYGAPHPPPGANHYSGQIGRGLLKWEMHTEFVTYTIFADGVSDPPFSGRLFDLLPADWLAAAPGLVVTSCIVRIERAEPETCEGRLDERGRALVRRREPRGGRGAGRRRGDRGGFPHRRAGPQPDGGAGPARASASGGWGGSCSGCWRSRPTSRCRC